MNKLNWVITGISSGFGAALAEAVLAAGGKVVGTFRNDEETNRYNAQNNPRGFGIRVDIRNQQDVDALVAFAEEKLKTVDVLVNNAGITIGGVFEERTVAEAEQVYAINVFGTWRVTQAFLPMLRKQRSGHILQMGSDQGMLATEGLSIYASSKFAIAGFSEALSVEIAPFGIQVTVVEPGPFKTNLMQNAKAAPARSEAYSHYYAQIEQRKTRPSVFPAEPLEGGIQAILTMTELENPPLRFPLGRKAVATYRQKTKDFQDILAQWGTLAVSASPTDTPP